MVVEAQGLRIQVCPKLDHLYYNPILLEIYQSSYNPGGVDGVLGL